MAAGPEVTRKTALSRRAVVLAAAPLAAAAGRAHAQGADMLAERLRDAVRSFGGGRDPVEARVRLEIAELVENGNVVPVKVSVQSPMTEADHVRAIAIFNERNQQRDVAVFQFGPHNGRAEVATRIRLATSQHVVAVARMSDGQVFTHHVEVVVTLAACID